MTIQIFHMVANEHSGGFILMNLLILDGLRHPGHMSNPLYRGTYRSHPSYCNEYPDDHEINKLFLWFIEEGGELGVVKDVNKSLRFAELLNKRQIRKGHFEVVEATDGDCCPCSKGSFIGFDLSSGFNTSLLISGLMLGCMDQVREPIREQCGLLSRQYSTQLNEYGLFQSNSIALSCLRSMTALQDLSPNLFEGGDLREFQSVGLYVIGYKS
jgi:hypothetical protein